MWLQLLGTSFMSSPMRGNFTLLDKNDLLCSRKCKRNITNIISKPIFFSSCLECRSLYYKLPLQSQGLTNERNEWTDSSFWWRTDWSLRAAIVFALLPHDRLAALSLVWIKAVEGIHYKLMCGKSISKNLLFFSVYCTWVGGGERRLVVF